jgi:integrase
MGTIVARKRKGGGTAYMAQIMMKREGTLHRETKTFDRRAAATAWIEKRERELSQPGGIARAKAADPTLAMAIDRYTTDQRHIGRTKAQVLGAIKGYPIAEMKCSEIKSHDVVELARTLAEGRTPQTVQNYLSHLSAVFTIARSAWGYELDRAAMQDAFVAAKRLGMTGRSRKRDRRPTLDEMTKLLEHFAEIKRRRPSSLPMCHIVAFALYSTRRQEEITRITWADYEQEASRIIVRDMKHPGEKIGNDVRCDLPKEAMAVIDAMPKTGDRIFPFSTDAIGAAFTRACHFLKIDDLHFHDLRHEGVSRLFEMGLDIPHVAAVSGHRSWTSLKRYTHLRHTGDRWAGFAKFQPLFAKRSSDAK